MVTKVFKYATGEPIPKGSKYLSTKVEEFLDLLQPKSNQHTRRLVWHYFLVEVK